MAKLLGGDSEDVGPGGVSLRLERSFSVDVLKLHSQPLESCASMSESSHQSQADLLKHIRKKVRTDVGGPALTP